MAATTISGVEVLVVDTSVLLALFFREPTEEWAAEQLNRHAAALCMSTVNLTETLIRLRDRQPNLADELEDDILISGIRFVAPDVEQSRIAAAARLQWPLNLGDCFAYALAVAESCPILPLDSDFLRTGHAVVIPERL